MADPAAKFHAHLDVCKQCRENPFDLCKTGDALLVTCGEKALTEMRSILGDAPSPPTQEKT